MNKGIQAIFYMMIFLSCNPEINKNVIADKYVEGFYRVKYILAINTNKNLNKQLFPLIDTIISQTKSNTISNELRNKIVLETNNIQKPKIEGKEYDKMMELKSNFENGKNDFIMDLDFIDKFLSQIEWQYWQENMGISGVVALFTFDTVMLLTNKEYEIPIRIEYNGLSSSISIISNSIQGSRPDLIKFKTADISNSYQTIEYKCEAINEVTREAMIYKNKLVIKLMKND